jgi:curved DNA-binding protein CbpA
LVEGIDLRALPIGPSEAFVLSHVDGATNESEIADEAALDPAAVAATLTELARLGAIRFDGAGPNDSTAPHRTKHGTANAARIGAIIEDSVAADSHHPAAALYDAAELTEDVEIEPERRRVILDTFYRLDELTHYQLLRVEPSAEKRTIKNAYYEIVNVFHPDRYFGKKLGSFKLKLERVFTRLTEAHDALTRSGPRAEYDTYLASLNKTQALDRADAAVQAQIQAIQRQIETEARAAEAAAAAPLPVTPAPPPPASATTTATVRGTSQQAGALLPPNAVPPRTAAPTPADAEARRRSLARKLGGRNLSGPQSVVTAPASARTGTHERAAEDLKRRYEQRITSARVDRAERYLLNARTALANKDPISAANALRIAQSLVPDNPEIGARLEAAHAEALSLLSNHYLTQAQYEEREGRLLEASRSYAKSALGSPSSRTFERAAYCALMAGGDLREAGDHARRAVALAPEDVQTRVTLARIYVAAGMKQSSLAEFERAATLAPKDDTIRDWIQRLKRGEA